MKKFPYITKEDFQPYAQVTKNIEDRFIELAVNKAYNLDILPVLNDTMLDNIVTVLAINPIQWSRQTAYVLNDKVFSDGIYYRCLIANTDSIPVAGNTNWTEIELMTFWTDYIKPYFILSAYARFLLWHGANITQYGTRQNNEDTSVEITDKRRGELLAETKEMINVYLSNLNKQFDSVGGTFDSTNYPLQCCDNNTPTRGGATIWGVGYGVKRSRKNNCGDYNNAEWQ